MPDPANIVQKAFGPVSMLKADGSNYCTWLQRITFAVCGSHCHALLSATSIASDKHETSDALLAALASKLPDSIFMNIALSVTIPSQIITTMKNRFGQITAISEADAQRWLFSMRCENKKKMQEHLDRLAAIKEEIAEAGIVFTDKTYTDAIIGSTPASYLPIVQAYKAAIQIHNQINPPDPTNPTLKPWEIQSDELVWLLRSEAQSRALMSCSKSGKSNEVAASADSRSNGGGRRGWGLNRRGRGRGQRENQNRDNQNNQDDENITCYKCGGKRHCTDVCASKKRTYKKLSNHNVHSAETNTSSGTSE
jgi:hypothetical protein